MKTGDRLAFISAAVEALPIHSLFGYELQCATCHYHSSAYGDERPCGVCGAPMDPRGGDYDDTGRPCDHGALLDRDQVLDLLERLGSAS